MERGIHGNVIALRRTTQDLSTDVADIKQDLRRLDERLFRLLVIQLATLAGTIGSLIVALVSLTTH